MPAPKTETGKQLLKALLPALRVMGTSALKTGWVSGDIVEQGTLVVATVGIPLRVAKQWGLTVKRQEDLTLFRVEFDSGGGRLASLWWEFKSPETIQRKGQVRVRAPRTLRLPAQYRARSAQLIRAGEEDWEQIKTQFKRVITRRFASYLEEVLDPMLSEFLRTGSSEAHERFVDLYALFPQYLDHLSTSGLVLGMTEDEIDAGYDQWRTEQLLRLESGRDYDADRQVYGQTLRGLVTKLNKKLPPRTRGSLILQEEEEGGGTVWRITVKRDRVDSLGLSYARQGEREIAYVKMTLRSDGVPQLYFGACSFDDSDQGLVLREHQELQSPVFTILEEQDHQDFLKFMGKGAAMRRVGKALKEGSIRLYDSLFSENPVFVPPAPQQTPAAPEPAPVRNRPAEDRTLDGEVLDPNRFDRVDEVDIGKRARRLLSEYFEFPEQEIPDLMGLSAIPGDNIRFEVSAFGDVVDIEVYSDSPHVGRMMRTIDFSQDPVLVHNELFRLKASAPPGTGTRILYAQAKAVQESEVVSGIECNAYRDDQDGFVGYYVWPRLGYDAPLPAEYLRLLDMLPPDIRSGLGHAPKVSDLMRTPEGRALWKEYGDSFDATFDPNGASMEILEAYIREKAAREGVGGLEWARRLAAEEDEVDAPVLTEEDEELLDQIWDERARQEAQEKQDRRPVRDRR